MQTDTKQIMPFKQALEQGEITVKKGWHPHDKDNQSYKSRSQKCVCNTPVTETGGSYTRIKIRVDNKEILYYHQKPVYMEYDDQTVVIAEPHYKKKKVRESVEEVLPRGYDLEVIGNYGNNSPKRHTWYITEPKYNEKNIYHKKEGAEKVDTTIKISKDEAIIKNL